MRACHTPSRRAMTALSLKRKAAPPLGLASAFPFLACSQRAGRLKCGHLATLYSERVFVPEACIMDPLVCIKQLYLIKLA